MPLNKIIEYKLKHTKPKPENKYRPTEELTRNKGGGGVV